MTAARVSLQADDHLVFLHILKTAGQTLMPILEHHFEAGDSLFGNWADIKPKSREELSRYHLIMGHNFPGIADLISGQSVFITFLRDPIERTISHFSMLKRNQYFYLWYKIQNMDFEAFLNDPETRALVENLQTRWLASDHGLLKAGEVGEGTLAKARERLERFPFVGITEQFDNSLFLLAYTFGWPHVNDYQVINRGENRAKAEDLSPAVLESIRQANALDLELYDFGVRLFQQRFKEMQQDLLSSSRPGAGGTLPTPPDLEQNARTREQEKWDQYYRSLPLVEEDDSSKKFSQEFVTEASSLLPDGGRVLELGSGGGWQSLALARTGKFEAHLMDFSAEALNYAEKLFKREGQASQFLKGDAFALDRPEYDLVFNLGSLEHYTFQDQVAFLKGMASRSRKYVLAVVPNQSSYWYWIWRIRNSGLKNWSFGKEVPMADLERAFQEAGLTFVGQKFLGKSWTESFLFNLPGMDDGLRRTILGIHQSAVAIPDEQKAYLVAGLGLVPGSHAVVSGWNKVTDHQEFDAAVANAALADALALQIGLENSLEQLRHTSESKNQILAGQLMEQRGESGNMLKRLGEQKAELDDVKQRLLDQSADFNRRLAESEALSKRLAEYESSRMGRFVRWVWRLRTRLIPQGSRRERLAVWTIRLPGKAYGRIHRWMSRRPSPRFRQEITGILQSHRDAAEIVVFAPSVEWNLPLFQRPQQMAKAFARQNALVFYCEPEYSKEKVGCVEIAPNLYRCNIPVQELKIVKSPAVVVFTYNDRWLKAFDRPRVIYEYIDELSVFPYDQHQLQESHRQLTQTADVVVATAKRLHDEMLAVRPDALLNPNGVDYLHFGPARERNASVPEDLQPIVEKWQPVIGYYGALAKWFDYDLLKTVAAARPQYQFVLIGPDYDGSLLEANLLALPNIHWLGIKKYNDLPAYLACFDVAMIPFRLNEITHSTSPLKLFEFMSAHKPVVITAMHESMRAEGVLVAEGPHEFSEKLDQAYALRNDPDFITRIDREALKNTWDERANEILSALKSRQPG